MTSLSRRCRYRARVTTATALFAFVAMLNPATARAADGDDPGLEQTIPAIQAAVHGKQVLESGHVDMGPKFDETGTWRLLIHDDAHRADAGATSVWRYPGETVFHVVDAAKLTVPDDPTYSFLGAKPGSDVWVVPQTQSQDVVWMGWNTQDPTVMQKIDRGATLTLNGVEGPGTVTVYLQSGSFDPPQTLWTSTADKAQPFWVDVNTHTHANWVFTKPGVYLMQVTASADLIDGTKATDTQVLRFAVGSATTADEAFAANWQGPASPAGTATQPANDGFAQSSDTRGAGLSTYAIGGGVLVLLTFLALLCFIAVRGHRAKRGVLALRAGSGTENGSPA